MLHPLEQVRDHQNPLAHTPALASRQAPQLRRPRFTAKEVCRHRQSPHTWYACLITLPHLEITGSRYKDLAASLSPALVTSPCVKVSTSAVVPINCAATAAALPAWAVPIVHR